MPFGDLKGSSTELAKEMLASGMTLCQEKELDCICPLLGRCYQSDPVWRGFFSFPHRLQGTRIFFCAAASYVIREGYLFRSQPDGGSFVGFMDTGAFSMSRMLDRDAENIMTELLCITDLDNALSIWQMANGYDESMQSLEDAAGDIYIFLFFTEPEKSGRGQGSRIIRSLQEGLRKHGLRCSLSTHNEKNLDMYRHLGFRVLRSQSNTEGDPQFFLHHP